MIEIIDEIVSKAKHVRGFGNRVYRSFPQLVDRMEPFAVVEKGPRTVVMSDDEGEEVIVSLSYNVSVFGNTPEDVDDSVSELTTIYNNLHIQNTGGIRSFQLSNGMYTSQVTFAAKVDKRGFVFAR